MKYSASHVNNRNILLSVKPKFANLIMAGSKRVELRRTIPAYPINHIAIYSSSPIRSIVAIADVKEIIQDTPSKLWSISKNNGGGLSKAEFESYFDNKDKGYAILLENINLLKYPIDPKLFFNDFTPPQSFKYLTNKELGKLKKQISSKRVK